ncbi:MAG TPA: exo-alpha-sialidase [Bacteroidetes bacterium]|nr:exo-alpha-sialidase [Bacteroidota bacterium]
MDKHQLLIGTSKGLVAFHKKAGAWQVAQVHFRGMPISMLYEDERTGTWWAGLSHRHWGQKLHFSKDKGQTWATVPMPVFPKNAETSPGHPASIKKVWCMAHAGTDRPKGLWLGTEPGGLFYSNDGGKNFYLNEGLWNHPSRMDGSQWFGAGRDEPFIHSILVDPRDSGHVYIAVSCAGVFETTDGGKAWQPRNKGLVAAYLPNPNVEVGHDPHLLLACRSNPDVLWQQNHCGIFRSTDGGLFWENVTDKNGLANYGFALAIDHEDPLRAWVIPAVSDVERIAPGLTLCICRTEDGGKNWTPLRNGLPQQNCFDIVFRHSLARKNKLLVFGTTSGNLYLSENDGEEWDCIANHLARVGYVAISSNV